MAIRTVIDSVVAELTTPTLSGVVTDENDLGIPASSLTAFTLTLYKAGDLASILNGRNKQNVLNANGVTVDGAGNFAWIMAANDNAVLGSEDVEVHIALFEWAWGIGRQGKHEVIVMISQLVGAT